MACLLRAPEHWQLCEELTRADFSSDAAWHLFEAVHQAAKAGLTGQALVEKSAETAASLATEIVKLAMAQPPQDFQPQQAITACAKRVKQNGVQKRLKEVQQQMKKLGAGNVPQELIQEYMTLQMKLKK